MLRRIFNSCYYNNKMWKSETKRETTWCWFITTISQITLSVRTHYNSRSPLISVTLHNWIVLKILSVDHFSWTWMTDWRGNAIKDGILISWNLQINYHFHKRITLPLSLYFLSSFSIPLSSSFIVMYGVQYSYNIVPFLHFLYYDLHLFSQGVAEK